MMTMIISFLRNLWLKIIVEIKNTSLYIIIRRRISIFSLLTAVLLNSSCLKDDLDFNKLKNPDWQPGLAIPLANSSMSISDLMKNESDSGNLVVDSANFCTLYYTGRAIDLKASDLVTIPGQHSNFSVLLNDTIADIINQTGNVSFSYFSMLDYGTNGGAELDSVFYKSGNAVLTVNSRIPANTILTITIPGATQNGIPFSQTAILNYAGTIPITEEIKFDLSQYKIDLTDNGTTHNKLRVDFSVDITKTVKDVQPDDKVNLIFAIYSTDFRKLFGYFGQQSFISPDDTLLISIFSSDHGSGSFTIAEPLINIDFHNSIGVPVQASVVSITGVNSSFTAFTPATGFPNPLPVFSPTISQIGQTVTGSFSMSTSNSNVHTVIENQPKYVISKIQSATNPGGNTGINFITDSSRFAVDVEVILPLYGTAKDFLLRDTVAFNYSNLNNVQELIIRTHLINGFPFDADWQIYFADANNQVIDSLVTQNKIIMPSGNVDPSTGRVTSASASTVDNTLSRDRIIRIMNAENLFIKAGISSANQGTQNVKIYSDYRFKVHIGAIAKIIL